MVVNFGFFACLRRIGFPSKKIPQYTIRERTFFCNLHERNLQQPHLTCHLALYLLNLLTMLNVVIIVFLFLQIMQTISLIAFHFKLSCLLFATRF